MPRKLLCKRGTKTNGFRYGNGTAVLLIYSCIKIHVYQRPPAATDPPAGMDRPAAAAVGGAGPSPTMVTQVSIISIHDSSRLRIK